MGANRINRNPANHTMSNHQQRLEQLQAQEKQLTMQLDEVRFLIVGYQNTIKQEQEKTEQATEE